MKGAFLVALVPALVSAQDVQLPLSGDRCANAIAPDALDALSVLQPADVLGAWQDMGVVDLLKEVGDDCGLEEERLVEVFGEGEARWMTEGDKLRLHAAGYDFMDITDHQDLGSIRRALPPTQLPSALPEISVDALSEIIRLTDGLADYTQMQGDLASLTSFWTRSYRSLWGARSSDWLYGFVGEIVKSADPSVNITIRRFAHSFPQKSLVVRLESAADGAATFIVANEDSNEFEDANGFKDAHNAEDPRLVIIGAHQDSLNYKLPFYRAPGADDDGSGTVALLQILRTLVGKSFTPPAGIAVELHWYAAEEGGLLGSQDVAAEYEREGTEVIGMLQMDGLAVVKHGVEPKIGLFQDEVDKGLLNYVTGLVDAYLSVPWALTGCGKRCGSDHMSWTRAGYRAAYVCEGLFEEMGEGYHTVNDTIDLLEGEYSFEHLQRFVKLGISFIVELSASSASLA